jgi:epoxide hydrolase 4
MTLARFFALERRHHQVMPSMENSLEHAFVDAAGVRLHVATCGTGQPVLLLHGFPEFWYSWRRQLPVLADAGLQAVAPDMRGYNLSDRPKGRRAYTISALVADVAALARRYGAPVSVVGHDWGGVVAWAFAGRHPELLQRLVIINAPHPDLYLRSLRRPPQMLMSWYVGVFQIPLLPELALRARDHALVRRMFRAAAARPHAFSEEEIDTYVRAIARPGALTAALNYYRAARIESELEQARRARVEAETMVIWGEKDTALDVVQLDGLERVAPRLRVHRLPDVGHWVQSEAPETVNRLLVEFLGRR